jgi:hypothetical protein
LNLSNIIKNFLISYFLIFQPIENKPFQLGEKGSRLEKTIFLFFIACNLCLEWNDNKKKELFLADCIWSGADRLVTGSRGGHLRLWATHTVGRLKGASSHAPPPGLTMEDEMTLDGAIVSVRFDENLEMVSACSSELLCISIF